MPLPVFAAGRAGWAVPVAVALAMTGANVAKPVHIDDSAYYQFARQAADHPLDPYRFPVVFLNRVLPANHMLSPPVVPYWWAAVIRLFGEDVAVWKASMFPFDFLYAGGLYALLRRFAPGWAGSLTVMAGLSPTILPATNLMLDIPSAGLGLAAVAVFAGACDRGSGAGGFARVLAAGLLAGLAVQAKYTGLLTPLLLAGYGWAYGRVGPGVVAAGVAGAAAAAWEVFLIATQGESHFVYHAFFGPMAREGKVSLGWALTSVLGQTAPFLGVLLAVGLRSPGWAQALGVTAALAGFAAQLADLPVELPIWRGIGLGVLAALAAGGRAAARATGSDRRPAVFLALWLGVEAVGYFALSPFTAVRRTIGLVTAGTLLAGYLLSRGPVARPGRAMAGVAVAGTVAAGAWVAALDHRFAASQKEAAEEAVARIRETDPGARIWNIGYWGFQFYAERAGARTVVPAALAEVGSPPVRRLVPWPGAPGVVLPEPTELRPGDWLIVPQGWVAAQQMLSPPGAAVPAGDVSAGPTDALISAGYYGGYWPVARLPGPHAEAHLFRIVRPFLPATKP